MADKEDAQRLEALERIDAYCDDLRVEHNASPHTLRSYGIDLRDYVEWAHRRNVDVFAPDHRQLRMYLGELDRARYAKSTINRRMSALKGFFGWMTVTGLIDRNPADILMSMKKDRTLPRRIPPSDMARILSVHGPVDAQGRMRDRTPVQLRNQALLEFLYACGARISEASDLRLASVDFEQSQVRVIGKGNKERIVPIHEIAVESMGTYLHFGRPQLLEGHGQSDFFFVSTRGNKMGTDSMRKMFKSTLQSAGVEGSYTPHDMRHTFASDVLEGGADLRSVQEMLGHSSLSTTQIYTHVTSGRLLEVHRQAHPRG